MRGRKTVITNKTLAKLEDAFLLGHTDQEACIIAGIDEATLYRYCDKNPNFARKKELLKQNPKISARRAIVKAIQKGDISLAKWYLERKSQGEFNPPEKFNVITEGQPLSIQVVSYKDVEKRKSIQENNN